MEVRASIVSQQVPYSNTSLSVATLEDAEALPDRLSLPNISPGNMDAITNVLSASLLITGNTVGSSMFVLPDAVGEVGLAMGSAIIFGKFAASRMVCVCSSLPSKLKKILTLDILQSLQGSIFST